MEGGRLPSSYPRASPRWATLRRPAPHAPLPTPGARRSTPSTRRPAPDAQHPTPSTQRDGNQSQRSTLNESDHTHALLTRPQLLSILLCIRDCGRGSQICRNLRSFGSQELALRLKTVDAWNGSTADEVEGKVKAALEACYSGLDDEWIELIIDAFNSGTYCWYPAFP